MRINSPNDLRVLGDTFGFIPDALLQRTPTFSLGQALFAGGFVAEPTVAQMTSRLTAEGGHDIPVPLR